MREPDEWMKPYIKRLRVQGFFVVRRGQAVDHDGNVCNLADIRTDSTGRERHAWLVPVEPLPEEKP